MLAMYGTKCKTAILHILSEHHTELQEKFTVKSLALFGSVARNESNKNSDIDLLVEFSALVGLFEFVALQHHLQALLGRNVDLEPLWD